MARSRRFRFIAVVCVSDLGALVVLSLLAGRATRTANAPLLRYDSGVAPRFEGLAMKRGAPDDVVILAFSGGGMRAAAFSYGVLETLRRIEIVTRAGRTVRLLDEVDLITGVSGGSFTALAYGLYGEKLFDEYEGRFLKRDVQGQLVARVLNPLNWSALLSTGWGRSELAANLYDEVLFHGATFADLERTGGPRIAVSATELTTGSRVVFMPQNFDVMCADLGTFRLARAAAASSAVPVVLSPLTHHQQLWRPMRLSGARVAPAVHPDCQTAAAGRAHPETPARSDRQHAAGRRERLLPRAGPLEPAGARPARGLRPHRPDAVLLMLAFVVMFDVGTINADEFARLKAKALA